MANIVHYYVNDIEFLKGKAIELIIKRSGHYDEEKKDYDLTKWIRYFTEKNDTNTLNRIKVVQRKCEKVNSYITDTIEPKLDEFIPSTGELAKFSSFETKKIVEMCINAIEELENELVDTLTVENEEKEDIKKALTLGITRLKQKDVDER